MPTMEYFGYSHEQTLNVIERLKRVVADLPFRHAIAFVLSPGKQSQIIGGDGSEQPFIGIVSRRRPKKPQPRLS